MSYGFRNTLILLTILIVLSGAGFGYLHFTVDKEITQRNELLTEKRTELDELEGVIAQFEPVQESLNTARQRLEIIQRAYSPINVTVLFTVLLTG